MIEQPQQQEQPQHRPHLPGGPMEEWRILQSGIKILKNKDGELLDAGVQLPPDEKLPMGDFLHFKNGEKLVFQANGNKTGETRDAFIKLADGTLVPFELWKKQYQEKRSEQRA